MLTPFEHSCLRCQFRLLVVFIHSLRTLRDTLITPESQKLSCIMLLMSLIQLIAVNLPFNLMKAFPIWITTSEPQAMLAVFPVGLTITCSTAGIKVSYEVPAPHKSNSSTLCTSSIPIRKPPAYVSPYPKTVMAAKEPKDRPSTNGTEQQVVARCTFSWCELKFERMSTSDNPAFITLVHRTSDAPHDPLAFGPAVDLDQWSFTKTSEYHGKLHPDGISNSSFSHTHQVAD